MNVKDENLDDSHKMNGKAHCTDNHNGVLDNQEIGVTLEIIDKEADDNENNTNTTAFNKSKTSQEFHAPSLKNNSVNTDDCKAVSMNPANGLKDSDPGNAAYSEKTNNDKLKKSINRTKSCLEDPPDGGWGWVVTFSAFMVGVILDGISFSFGLFFKELYVYFNESKSVTSWIISVLNGTYLGIGPVASVFVSIFGCRKVAIFGAIMSAAAFFLCTWSPNVQVMILLYGLLGGAGLGLLYLPSIVTVGHYFKKKRALATGIAVCGSGIGGFVFAPLSQFLIDMYTWKGAMWVISAIALNGVVVAALLRPLEKSPNKKRKYSTRNQAEQTKLIKGNCDTERPQENQKCCDLSNMFDFSLLKSPTFLVYGCSCFLCMLGFYIPFTYIPDLVEDYGMTSQQSALLISIIGILNTVARVMVGWIADRPWADALILNSIALVVGGISTMFVPYFSSFGLMATYSVVFGVAIAVFVSLRSIIMAELLGIEKLTSSFGLVTMCQGLSAFIGAPIAGALSDITGNYRGAFYLAGAAICLSGSICFPLRRISKWENQRKRSDNDANAIAFSSDLVIHVSSKQSVNV